jgi:hypothetical protein
MHNQRNVVTLVKIEKLVARPGFAVPFHRATFELAAEGGMHSTVQVWVPATHADAQLERVARMFLSHRLAELAEIARGVSRAEQPATTRAPEKKERRRIPRDRLRRSAGKHGFATRFKRVAPGEAPGKLSLERYVLNGREPVRCNDLPTWKAWMETPERLIQDSSLEDNAHNLVRVCTVFLGIDVSFGIGQPILFETMVLGGKWDRELYRYCTWAAAHKGHAAIVQGVRDLDPNPVNDILLKARDLASMTISRSGKVAVSALVEEIAVDFRKVG